MPYMLKKLCAEASVLQPINYDGRGSLIVVVCYWEAKVS